MIAPSPSDPRDAAVAQGKGPTAPADVDDMSKLEQPSAAAPPPSVVSKDSGFMKDGVDARRPLELRAEPPKETSKNTEPKALLREVAPSTQSSQNAQITQSPPAKAKGPYVQRNDSRNDQRAIEQNRAREREADLAMKGTAKKRDNAPGGAADTTSDRKRVGGKTFEFRSGAWYDTTYRGQGTVNVRRRTENYDRLDRGLRSIADSFIGTVVTVWNGKAYRID